MRLLAYIGRFFHGLAPQPGLETVYSYVGGFRFFSRTDKGVNAVANPIVFEGEFVSDFVLVRGSATGRPRRKEYRYFMPEECLKKFYTFLELVPSKIDAKAFVRRPRRKFQEMHIEVLREAVSFSSSGFETYAIRRLMGYFLWRLRGIMTDQEVVDALKGDVRRYPPLAPPEPLALWKTDVEFDDGNRRRIERRISSRCLFNARRLLKWCSKRLIKRTWGRRF